MTVQPRFVCDVMHGNLAKWLRLLGYDTLYSRRADDNELLRTVQRESRVLLTKDYQLYRRCMRRNPGRVSCVFITADALGGQIREVLKSVHGGVPPMSRGQGAGRCAQCNGLLQIVRRDALPEGVPSHVRESCSTFRQCASCKKIYWDGSHRRRIDAIIRDIEETLRGI